MLRKAENATAFSLVYASTVPGKESTFGHEWMDETLRNDVLCHGHH